MPPTNTQIIWNSYQKNIFKHIEQPKDLVIQALAGTGKTKTLEGICQNISNKKSILMLAFNNKIKKELILRIGESFNKKIKTTHGYGYAAIVKKVGPITLDKKRDQNIVSAVIADKETDDVKILIESIVSFCKTQLINPVSSTDFEIEQVMKTFDCLPEKEADIPKTIGYVRDCLSLCLKVSSIVSYDDMVYIPAILGWNAGKFDFILVDEVQDLNKAQRQLVKNARHSKTKCFFVGDKNQAIYGWRGADSNSISSIVEETDADELTLPVTYRCGKKIVELAQELVPDYIAGDKNPEGVVNHNVSKSTMIANVSVGDFILSRKNAPLMSLCLSLLGNGKPAVVAGRDISSSLLSLIAKCKEKTIEKFLVWLDGWRTKELAKISKEEEKSKYDNINDKADCLVVLSENLNTVYELVQRIKNIFVDEEDDETTNKKIVLSSVHKAKGLEADTVWILQSTLSVATQEEKNIKYVAITRAKNTLNMVVGKF